MEVCETKVEFFQILCFLFLLFFFCVCLCFFFVYVLFVLCSQHRHTHAHITLYKQKVVEPKNADLGPYIPAPTRQPIRRPNIETQIPQDADLGSYIQTQTHTQPRHIPSHPINLRRPISQASNHVIYTPQPHAAVIFCFFFIKVVWFAFTHKNLNLVFVT